MVNCPSEHSMVKVQKASNRASRRGKASVKKRVAHCQEASFLKIFVGLFVGRNMNVVNKK